MKFYLSLQTTFLTFAVLLGSGAVQASVGPQPDHWEKVFSCNNDELVVDTGWGQFGSQMYQVVIRGEAFQFLNSRNAIPTYDIVPEGHSATIPITRNLSQDGFVYYASMYMSMGQPETMAFYDILHTENGMLLRFNQRGRNYTEYYFGNCEFLRNP